MAPEPILEARKVTIAYGRTSAVMDLSFYIEEGEAIALVGPNGAGKTTTLSALAGVLRPRTGSFRFRGHEINGEAPEKLVRRGIALVPEGRQIFATLTVGENLRLASANLTRAEAPQAMERELERFPELRKRFDSPAGGLSGGQQQQLAIARALACNPKLLLLDEPSLGLAPKLVDVVFEALVSLRAEGVTMLLVEQNAVRAVEFADRTYVINAGRLVTEGTRDELHDMVAITESYFGGTETGQQG